MFTSPGDRAGRKSLLDLIQTIAIVRTGNQETIAVNSSSYVSLAPLEVSVDNVAFPFNYYRIRLSGGSSQAAQTVTIQLANGFGSPTVPLSKNGDDLVVSNAGALYDSGWIYRELKSSSVGVIAPILAVKGSNTTVDLNASWFEIMLRVGKP